MKLEAKVLAYMPGTFKGDDGKPVEWNNVLIQTPEGEVVKISTAVDTSPFTNKDCILNVQLRAYQDLKPKLKLLDLELANDPAKKR